MVRRPLTTVLRVTSTSRVVRLMRQADWSALAGSEVTGTAHGVMRPDGRWFVSIDTWRVDVFGELLDAMASDLRQRLHVTVDDQDRDGVDRWLRAGFEIARRQHEYELPTDPAVTRLGAEPLPPGITLVGADEVDESELRALDDALRQDVPGTQGWYSDPGEFREHTFDGRQFDPAVYLVAVDDVLQVFAGLVRVWVSPRRCRLGLIGVVPGYRGAGLARAMLATVLRRLHDRGVDRVFAEADTGNAASNALLVGSGARRVGGTLELTRLHT